MKPELTWTPFLFLVHKELLRFWRVTTQTLMIPIVNSFLYLVIFGVSLGKNIDVTRGGTGYLEFLIPGLVSMSALYNAFQNSSSSIATSKFHGDLEDLLVSPIKPLQILLAMGLVGTLRGILAGALTFAMGEVFYYLSLGRILTIREPMIMAFFLVCGGMCFSLLGVTVALRAKTYDQLGLIGGFILLPLIYLGGAFYFVYNLKPFWQTISRLNPLFYFISGTRFGFFGTSEIPWLSAAAWSLAALAISALLAYRTITKASYSRW